MTLKTEQVQQQLVDSEIKHQASLQSKPVTDDTLQAGKIAALKTQNNEMGSKILDYEIQVKTLEA